jgi:hypothetical protein
MEATMYQYRAARDLIMIAIVVFSFSASIYLSVAALKLYKEAHCEYDAPVPASGEVALRGTVQ